MKKVSLWIKNVGSLIAALSIILFAASCEKDSDPEPGQNGIAKTDTITQDINSKTILKDIGEGVDYYICGSIGVNAELSIEPGVTIIMCSGAGIYVEPDGSLNAVGTAEAPISITGEVVTAGFWKVIEFDSNNPNNVLEYVMVSDGGGSGSYDYASVWVNNNNNGQATIKNSIISNSKGFGVLVEDGATLPGFSSNQFSNNGDAGIKIPLSIIGAMDEASDYADENGNNYIHVYGTDLNQDQTVKATNAPFLIEGNSNIQAGLTLNAGVNFLMGAQAGLYVESDGFFNAIGTVDEPITILGEVESVGYWRVIEFDANNPKNEFAYVTIKNGGGSGSYNYATIWVNDNNNGSFTMNNCTVADSYGWGLYVENGATIAPSTAEEILSANTFSNNGTGSSADCTGDCNIYLD